MKLISERNYSNIIFYDDILVEPDLYFVVTRFLNELNGLMVIHDAEIEIIYIEFQLNIPTFHLVASRSMPHQTLEDFCDKWPAIYTRLFKKDKL